MFHLPVVIKVLWWWGRVVAVLNLDSGDVLQDGLIFYCKTVVMICGIFFYLLKKMKLKG